VLRFERRLVRDIITGTGDDRAEVEAYVDDALGNLPEHIRLGVGVESVAFSTWSLARRVVTGRQDRGDELLDRLERNPIGLIRQYPRLLRSLVLFAEQERLGEREAAAEPAA
jgi:hypothetical protein